MAPSTVEVGLNSSRPPLLLAGQYQHWKTLFIKWVQSHDYQCWLIISLGDMEIADLEKKKKMKKWEQEDLQTMEKNCKAAMLINNALNQQDVQKLQSCETANAKWLALDQMYMGSKDLREVDRFTAKKDFYNFKMGDDEDVSSYQERFEKITANLTAHSVKDTEILPDEKILIIIDGLPHRHAMTKAILKENPSTVKLTFHEVFSKIQKYDNELKAGTSNIPPKDKGLALMVEKAVDRLESNKDDNDGTDDHQVVMLTKVMRALYNKGKNSYGGNRTPRDIKDVTCFNCNEKGHYSSTCPKPKKQNKSSEDEEKNAFVAMWGNGDESDNEDPEAWSGKMCAMALNDPSEEPEVNAEAFMDSLVNFDKKSLIALIKDMYSTNLKTQEELANSEDECSSLKEHVSNYASSSTVSCTSCDANREELQRLRNDRVSQLMNEVSNNSSEGNSAVPSKIEVQVTEMRAYVKQMYSVIMEQKAAAEEVKFVKPRYGIGYKGPNQKEEDDATIEELREARDKELQDAREKNKNLEERVKVLESGLSEEQPWYTGQPAHKIFLKQSQGNQSHVPCPERTKQRKSVVPNKKYVQMDQFKLCWFCGDNRHVQRDCAKKKKFSEEHTKRRNNGKNSKSNNVNLNDFYDDSHVQNNNHTRNRKKNVVTVKTIPVEQVHYVSRPGKGKLAWVAKS